MNSGTYRCRPFWAYGSLFAVFLLANCARFSRNEVSVVGRNFGDEVQQTQNLTFTFNKDVGPRPNRQSNASDDAGTAGSGIGLGEWDSTRYVRFKPAVRGKFKWTAPNELLFSPAVAFDPATNYRAELTDELLKRAPGTDWRVSSDDIPFHTPYLHLTGTETWWTRSRETGGAVAKARLNFNYPIPTAELTGKIGVTTDGKPLTAQVAPANAKTGVVLTLTNVPTGGARREQPLTVRVDKGLNVPNTGYVSREVLEQTASLPAQTVLDVTDVQTQFDNGQGVVRIVTTQELQPGNLSQYYTIQPQLDTQAELTENGFIIRGAFNEADTYVLTLNDGLRGVLGATLTEPVTHDLFFGKMPASIQFARRDALYLSSKGARNIGLNIVNVPKVQVKIAKVYENNILHYLRTDRYEEYEPAGKGEDYSYEPSGRYTYSTDASGDLSDVLVNKTVETNDLPKVGAVSALNVALPDARGSAPAERPFLGRPPQASSLREHPLRGVYVVSVNSKNEAYLGATQLVVVSDIGLIARQTKDEVLVWASSIQTAEPLADVSVTLVSRNNQSVYTRQTDSDGFVRFDKVSEQAPGFTIALVTARRADDETGDGDFTFLHLPDTAVETSRYAVDGKRDNPTGFDAFVYGDRTIYRPGETMHVNTVVRSATWQSAGEIPLLIRVLTPNGREFRSFRKTTNAQGAVSTDVPLDPAAVTGTYTIEVAGANGTLIASQPISVEEFIPDRIKVDVTTDRPQYHAGQTITASATATNLFGPPATDRTYEMELQLARKSFTPKGYDAYSFAMTADQVGAPVQFPKELRQGRTDDRGQANAQFPVPALYQDMGLLDAKLFITIFDENGRPVNRLRRFDVQTQDVFFGIRLPDRYVATNVPVAVDLVVLNAAGTPLPAASATVEVIRYDYQTVIEKQGEGSRGTVRYTTKRREKRVYTNALTFKGGRASFRYVPTVSGEYQIRVRRAGTTAGYAAFDFDAYGYNDTSASSFDVSSEGQVLITTDKPTYRTGDKATLLFKAPFDGRLLVSVERNRVLEHHWLTTKDKSAEWSFAVRDEHLPNVYVTATLIRAMDGANLPLTVAHGFAPVAVAGGGTQLPVAITAAAQSRSKVKQTIRVKTARNAQITVAVVDEGILQIKNTPTPDPHGFFYQKRALEVGNHDLYALLYPELALRSTASSVGGDGYDLQRRVNPLSNGRVKLVALWSGILETGLDGEAEFTVDVPQFSGNLRVMAVAYKDNAFGSASRNMQVSDPIVISAGVPRFLSPGDQIELPVTLSNTTRQPATVTARLSLTGPLTPDSLTTQKLTIPAGREGRAQFRLTAKQAIGLGSVLITVNGGPSLRNETFTEQTDVTVRPAASLVKTTLSGVVASGQSQTLRPAGGFLPGTGRVSVTLSRSPVAQYGRELGYLLGYPHGCIEQIISKAFPQLYFADLTKQLGPTTYFVRAGGSDQNPATNVQQAIQTVESQQTYNGGFSMWPELPKADPWASAYAVHFLTEAGAAGYEVRASVLSKAIEYLTSLTNKPATEEIIAYDEAGERTVRTVPNRTNLYGLYVLTVAGRPNRAAMNYYKQNAGRLTTDGRYVLAAAFYRIGDTRSYAALLPKQYAEASGRGIAIEREAGGSYASPLRNLALALDVLVDTDRDNLQIPPLARQLGVALKQTGYLNTQEAAFALLALGKLARQDANNTATATLSAGGKAIGTLNSAFVSLKRVPAGPLTVQVGGSGRIYYFVQSEGVPAQTDSASGRVTETDNGLRVRRTYLDRNGQPVAALRQNDLVVVKLTLVSTSGLPVENVVLTDLLPAGLEVENPRLTSAGEGAAQPGGARSLAWIKKPSTPDHFDLRDDRINFYVTATSTKQTYYYMARAVSKGRFVVGPASADAMYNPDYRSYHGAGTVTIR